MVFCDARGELFDHPFYRMAVDDGVTVRPPRADELVTLPAGSDVWMLPGRAPIGINPDTGGPEVMRGVQGASAFASPAYLRLALPAYEREPGAPVLPLFAYAPLGWWRGRLVTTAVRVDRSNRQDPCRFDREEIGRLAKALLRRMPANRLAHHLEHCAMVYGCRAAQNFFLGREEGPLPTSPACNSGCAGCLSHAPDGDVTAPHDRITFVPTPDEIAEVACLHIGRVRRAVVSFGQGCEGEPLLQWRTLEAAIRLIRRRTPAGTINLNTNGSLPDAVAALCEAGLDAIRLSVNSFDRAAYDAYYRPRGYTLDDVLASGRAVRASGGFVSVNLLVFPGVSDREDDVRATIDGLQACGADFVQMRNLNIDPEVYRGLPGMPGRAGRVIGLGATMDAIRGEIPAIRFGYFNPPVRTRVLRRRRASTAGVARPRPVP
jgi:pyruvate-formate lyase-activating enzyme